MHFLVIVAEIKCHSNILFNLFNPSSSITKNKLLWTVVASRKLTQFQIEKWAAFLDIWCDKCKSSVFFCEDLTTITFIKMRYQHRFFSDRNRNIQKTIVTFYLFYIWKLLYIMCMPVPSHPNLVILSFITIYLLIWELGFCR